MENTYFIDGAHLTPEALRKKHRLENDPSFRTDPMEYLPNMERISSDVCEKVLTQMYVYDEIGRASCRERVYENV